MTTRRLPKPFSAAEISALQRAARSRPDVWAACVFLRETGLRSAEACSITTQEATTWPHPPWWCQRPTCPRHTAALRVIGKGDRERVVVLTPAALRAAVVLSKRTRNGHLVPWTDRGLRYLMAELGERAGVHCHPHRWRHTCATELVESGVPIEVVADMLGHSQLDITRLYWSASSASKTAALARRGRWRRRLARA